jgi:PPK2 family polyphosphate:nucleotide phosphotransferase
MRPEFSCDQYQVGEGQKVRLKDWPTEVKPLYKSKDEYEELLEKYKERLFSLQTLLYAHDRYSLLLIFQGLDAAGKDGAIKHVMSGLNPQGCQVFSFKAPSSEELDHDFLWRAQRCLPERGRIGIFNRSYYEEVLVVRVHPEILRAQPLPEEIVESPDIWKQRYRSIVDFERHLFFNGTRTVKFFFHLSKEEQRKRFLKRLDDPEGGWKFKLSDVRERQWWGDYTKAYEKCLSATSTQPAPWFAIPADDKRNARLIICQIIVSALKGLKMEYPKPSGQQRELRMARKLLEK